MWAIKEDEPLLICTLTACTVISQYWNGVLFGVGVIIGIGALINKKTLKGGRFFERWYSLIIARRALNPIITDSKYTTCTLIIAVPKDILERLILQMITSWNIPHPIPIVPGYQAAYRHTSEIHHSVSVNISMRDKEILHLLHNKITSKCSKNKNVAHKAIAECVSEIF